MIGRCKRVLAGLGAACALGCETTAAPDGASDPTASTAQDTGSSSGAGTTTYDPPVECAATDECAPGFCVAPYDAGVGGAAGRGDAVCVDACVPELALELWCIDDAACCDGLECGAIDGLCLRPDDGTTTDPDTWATLGTTEDSGSSDSSTETSSSSDGSSGDTSSSGTDDGTSSTG